MVHPSQIWLGVFVADRNPDGTWAVGHPGGPGRGKKLRRIEHILEKIGLEPHQVGELTVTKLEAVLRSVYDFAFAGQSWAVQFIAERTEGKVRDQIGLEVDLPGPIRVLNLGEDDPDA